MDSGILDWQNEHRASDYPLASFCGFNDLLLDASFTQFDGFIPVLNELEVGDNHLRINLTFDLGTEDFIILYSSLGASNSYRFVSNARQLGTLVFGAIGLTKLRNEHSGAVFKWEIPFSAATVTSVNSKSGVQSIDNLSGDLKFVTGDSSVTRRIFFNVTGNTVVWNAAALASMPDEPTIALKTLNREMPLNNATWIHESDLIKIEPGNAELTVRVTGNTLGQVGPAQNYEA